MTRKIRDWPRWERPMLLPLTGFRDQSTRVTYMPWTDVELGLVGWQVIPDRSDRIKQGLLPVLVYVLPTVDQGVFEIRCHVTDAEPNPNEDQVLGTVTIPPEMLGIKPDDPE